MSGISALFWDVGGVILTNGWDSSARRNACSHFDLDCSNFEAKHESLVEYLELGRLSLDDYLDQAIFYRPRYFSKEEFKAYVFGQSQANAEVFSILDRLASSVRRFMATINNESRELNLYRIERFQLRNYFSAFFTSSFLGMRKPFEEIFRVALEVTQRSPEECLMIDDREENLMVPRKLGMRTLHYRDPRQLELELQQKLAAVRTA